LANVKAESKFIETRHRFEIHDHKILWTLTGGANGELRVASRVKAGVPAHRLLETLLVFGGNVGSVVKRVEARIAALQVKGFNKAVKLQATDRPCVMNNALNPYKISA